MRKESRQDLLGMSVFRSPDIEILDSEEREGMIIWARTQRTSK